MTSPGAAWASLHPCPLMDLCASLTSGMGPVHTLWPLHTL